MLTLYSDTLMDNSYIPTFICIYVRALADMQLFILAISFCLPKLWKWEETFFNQLISELISFKMRRRLFILQIMTLYAKLVGGGGLLLAISAVNLEPFITSKYLTFGNDISGCITSTTQQSLIPLYFSLWLLQWIMMLDLQPFIIYLIQFIPLT
jgi:hypothetical protein